MGGGGGDKGIHSYFLPTNSVLIRQCPLARVSFKGDHCAQNVLYILCMWRLGDPVWVDTPMCAQGYNTTHKLARPRVLQTFFMLRTEMLQSPLKMAHIIVDIDRYYSNFGP